MTIDIVSLYRLYGKELLNYLTRMVSCRETAHDIVQESYLILTRTAAETVIEQPRGFLYRTANNLAIDHLRHRKIVTRHEEQAVLDAEPISAIEHQLADEQRLDLLRQAISELPPRCRDAFVLHKLHGLSYRQTAERLGVSESAVEKHIMKGLDYCRTRLGRDFRPPRRRS